MARLADCRKCEYFVPESRLAGAAREKALSWIEKRRPGAPLLGYCTAYSRPVTYYVGSCYRYTPRPQPRPKSILQYLSEAGGRGA